MILTASLAVASEVTLDIEDCGDKSLRECRDATALIIIDMQPYFAQRNGAFKDGDNPEKIDEIIYQQQRAIEVARAHGMPIVVIEYDCTVCDPTTERLTSKLKGYEENSVTIKKSTDGMFDSWNHNIEALKTYLDAKGVDNLIITGANGGACVNQSIHGALINEYDVMAISNSIADFNYEKFMYPYSYKVEGSEMHRFSSIEAGCENCSFKEYNSLEQLQLDLNLDPWKPVVRKSTESADENRSTLENILKAISDAFTVSDDEATNGNNSSIEAQ